MEVLQHPQVVALLPPAVTKLLTSWAGYSPLSLPPQPQEPEARGPGGIDISRLWS